MSAGIAERGRLAGLRRGACGAVVLTAPGKLPCLHIPASPAGMLGQPAYAGDGWYWQGWAERIAEVTDAAAAAEEIVKVLRPAGER